MIKALPLIIEFYFPLTITLYVSPALHFITDFTELDHTLAAREYRQRIFKENRVFHADSHTVRRQLESVNSDHGGCLVIGSEKISHINVASPRNRTKSMLNTAAVGRKM